MDTASSIWVIPVLVACFLIPALLIRLFAKKSPEIIETGKTLDVARQVRSDKRLQIARIL